MNTTSTARGRGATARTVMPLAALLLPALLAAAPSPPPKAISNTAGMNFGRFASAGGGAITVDASGARTRSGAVVLLNSNPGPGPARYTISGIGNDNRVYTLTLPPDGAVVLASGANTMGVNSFVSSAPPGGMLLAGPQSISVGATLQVAPGQLPGNYSGAFQVTLNYQ